MTVKEFLDDFKSKSNEITYMAIRHFLLKIYKLEDIIKEEELEKTLSNYPMYMKYLNDYCGMIYKRYDSSIDEIYTQTCDILGYELDNKELFEYRLSKLELNDVSRIMQIANEDIQKQTLQKQYNNFLELLESKYYKANSPLYEINISKINNKLSIYICEVL